MHPGPIGRGVEITLGVARWKSFPLLDQVGKWSSGRMAVI
jgi:aspartate carbamoyltransferase catalytic subunit